MRPDKTFFDRLAEVAKAETLPRFRSGLDVVNKDAGGYDPVTEGDRAAETAIRTLIEAEFPDHGILGEEHDSIGLGRDCVWVIDPIDGTRAFISGLPTWGTLIGFQQSGRAVMGMMDQPFTGERYFADGEKAWYQGPDGARQIKTRACTGLGDAVLYTTSPDIFLDDERQRFDAVRARVRLTRYGVDCYAYALLAAGFVDLVIETGLKPYDVGALIPIIEQAGGVVTTWDGGQPEAGGKIIAASSRAVYDEARALLNA
ncbi:histidinol-phosphatase [Allorhizobium taibaishanense]|uniref:Histidinol-phosphatase n=1 Tax=Allorhizobium taibaishanense TaxID=887144 RepID=A0A1Q9A5Q8_9HYPH|nr:histidinol-phosphatase [Allorhizobium taibaishanense]MBB4006727.1 histidinol phosphatase-like enzyme (inositol monophosphatase family) [Allorhizobium taibaishanense]OLP49911.1 histidinol-phosphatase [Allorhizobium taibaishanense]